ncbi:MAG: hypothetical protein ATN36_02790 [Epulopiscium sp. Nele67-Bin005]|nr:MAG: hypothetical protein ATN36_02790 [Epulopiscium sp. Nele67-Bin005]
MKNFVIASNCAYVIGKQDGTFVPLGFHVEGKMSGIFAQPYRISDGFRVLVNNEQVSASAYTFDGSCGSFLYDGFNIKISALDNTPLVVIDVNGSCEVVLPIKIESCWTGSDLGDTKLISVDTNHIAFGALDVSFEVLVEGAIAEVLPKDNFFEVKIKFEGVGRILVGKSCDLDIEPLIKSQMERRNNILNMSHLVSSDALFDDAFNGLKITYDMLIQKIDGIGEGFTAGFPDFPWFFGCDSAYGVYGALVAGQHEMCKQTLRLLRNISLSHNGNGRVIHEVSPLGVVYGDGNLQETPHFVCAVWEVYKWTGDKVFLQEMFEFCVMGMEWAGSFVEEGSLCPKGSGIVEVIGLSGRVIDIAVLMVDAYDAIGKMSDVFDVVHNYNIMRDNLATEIVEKFYCKQQQFFGDILCSYDEIMSNRDILINSIKNTNLLSKKMSEYFDEIIPSDELIPVVLNNWVCVLPYAKSFVPQEIVSVGVSKMKEKRFFNDFGMKLGCMVDDKEEFGEDIYCLNKSMSINTGVLAEVFACNNDVDFAYSLLNKLVDCYGVDVPNCISEILPDDGCFMQLWSGYGIHNVYLRCILGIEPDAPNGTLILNPKLPSELSFVKIENLLVGESLFDVSYKRVESKIEVCVMKDGVLYDCL